MNDTIEPVDGMLLSDAEAGRLPDWGDDALVLELIATTESTLTYGRHVPPPNAIWRLHVSPERTIVDPREATR